MNRGDKHISGPFSVTTESWHRASVEQSQGSGRAFLSAAIAGVRVWAPWPRLHLHAAQLSLEMGSDLPGLDAPGRPLVSHCSLGSSQNHQRPQHLSSSTSAVLHCQLNLARGGDFRAEQQHLVKAGWVGREGKPHSIPTRHPVRGPAHPRPLSQSTASPSSGSSSQQSGGSDPSSAVAPPELVPSAERASSCKCRQSRSRQGAAQPLPEPPGSEAQSRDPGAPGPFPCPALQVAPLPLQLMQQVKREGKA